MGLLLLGELEVLVLPALAVRGRYLALVLCHILSICLYDAGQATSAHFGVGDGRVDPVVLDLAHLR